MEYRTYPHIIHRQVLDLSLPAGFFPSEVQESFRNTFYNSLPDIEEVFSLYDDPGQLILVDKIVVDLGRIEYEKLDELFSLRLCEALSKALHDSVGIPTKEVHKDRDLLRGRNKPAKSTNVVFPNHNAAVETEKVSTYTVSEGIR
ncbi:MAG TPA: contractile injection system tape measure protein, partial [Chitinophagaceae bacterium]|nr:contractile injection system tape measure protein [Chitinophagaceae bacterium]